MPGSPNIVVGAWTIAVSLTVFFFSFCEYGIRTAVVQGTGADTETQTNPNISSA